MQFSFCFDYQWDRLLFYAVIFLLVATASFAYSTSSPLPCSSFCSFCTDHLLLLAQKHAHTHIHTHTYTHSHTHLLMPQENPSRILAPMIISQRSIRNHLSQQQSWKGLHSKYFRGWCTTIKKQNPLESQTSSSKKLFETRIKRISKESYKKNVQLKKICSELSSHKNRETNPNAAEKWCWENPWTIGGKNLHKELWKYHEKIPIEYLKNHKGILRKSLNNSGESIEISNDNPRRITEESQENHRRITGESCKKAQESGTHLSVEASLLSHTLTHSHTHTLTHPLIHTLTRVPN